MTTYVENSEEYRLSMSTLLTSGIFVFEKYSSLTGFFELYALVTLECELNNKLVATATTYQLVNTCVLS